MMSKATVTFEDIDGQVSIKLDFGDGGANEASPAHHMAVEGVHHLQMRKPSNFERTANWLSVCGKTPCPEDLSVQIGVGIEEFCEFLRTLRTDKEGYAKLLERTYNDLEWFATKLKRREQMAYIPIHLRAAALDSLCDMEVGINGVAFLAQMKKMQADMAVLDANDDKLVDGVPVILDGGKIGKREGWTPPDLSEFV